MNKPIQIKRNKPANSHYRVLYAKTGRKRRLHAATTATADQHAGMGADVPNISVGRALFVILILHVLAVAAIYIHSAFFGDASNVTANEGQQALAEPAALVIAPTAPGAQKKVTKKQAPIQQSITGRHIVIMGDTYPRIAANRNVSVKALRALNGNQTLRAGIVLDLPAELSARPVNPAPAAVKAAPAAKPKAMPKPAPKKVAPAKQRPVAIKAKKATRVAEASASKPSAAQASGATSEVVHDVRDAPKALVIEPEATSAIQDSGKTYTIKPGDTLWAIASRLKVSRDNLLKLNKIEDANKLYSGRTIKVPAN